MLAATTLSATAQAKVEAAGLLRDLMDQSQKFLLLRIRKGKFGNTRSLSTREKADKLVTAADQNMVGISKKLLNSPELQAIDTLDREIDHYLRLYAIPTVTQPGLYAVPVATVQDVVAEVERLAAKREELVEAAADAYDMRVAQSLTALADMGRRSDYPTRTEFKRRYYVEYFFMQMGVPAELADISQELYKREVAKAREEGKMMLEEMKDALRLGLKTLVDKARDRLTRYDRREQRSFKQSGIDSIMEFIGTFDARNVLGDDDLRVQVDKLRKVLDGLDAEDIRDSESLRGYTLKAFNDVAGSLDGMIQNSRGRVFAFDEMEEAAV